MRWTRSPPDLHHEHVLNRRPSGRDKEGYLLTCGHITVVRSPLEGQRVKLYGATNLHQITINIGRLTRSSSNSCVLSRRTTIDARSWFDRCGSWPDRHAIVADHHGIVAQSPHNRRRSLRQKQHLWKLHDLTSIAMQSKPDCHAIVPTIGANSPLNQGQFVAALKP